MAIPWRAALSMSAITGKTINSSETGENYKGRSFYPGTHGSVFAGYGRWLSLIEEAEKLNQSNNNLSKKKKGKTLI